MSTIYFDEDKQSVKDFWNSASCGEKLLMKGDETRQQFINQMKERYILEPEILDFTRFEQYLNSNKKVLEIGVGLGSDHQKWAESGVELYGIDLTERAISWTKQRMELFGLISNLQVADAENIPFGDNYFDIVYSWGVIMASPDTKKVIDEIYRILKPNGEAIIMIYQKYSMVGYMLWLRYALLTFKPWLSLNDIYNKYLESPGMKCYSETEARELFNIFTIVELDTNLCHGDLLTSGAGQRHEGFFLTIARIIYPKFIIRKLFKKHGLFMKLRLKKAA